MRTPQTAVPGIYTVTNTVSGCVYVGRSMYMQQRWSDHRQLLVAGKHHNRYLQGAWLQYGPDAFEFAVWKDLSDVPKDRLSDELHKAEAKALVSFPNTYNLSAVGPTRIAHAPETIALMSEKRAERWTDPAYRETALAKMREAAARPESRKRKSVGLSLAKNRPEELAKSAARTQALWDDPEYREKVTAANRAAKATPEYLAAHSERMKEIRNRPDQKAKQSESNKANWQRPEYRAAQLAARAASLTNPAHRKAHSKGVAASWADPEVRAKRSAAMQAAWVKRRAAAARAPTP